MAHVVSRGPQLWRNYHGTATCSLEDQIELFNGAAITGRAVLKEAALAIQALLQRAKTAGRIVRPVGSGWSPSELALSEGGWQVETTRLNRGFRIARGDLAEGAEVAPESLLLCQAGMLVDEVSDRAEREMGRALRTAGASNGQTLAGACATGTHGSVLGMGGIQDQVRAVQIVTPAGIFWIEPDRPVLSDAFIEATGSAVIRSDEVFAAAQLAVGAMGFVTALLIETVPIYLVRAIQKKHVMTREELAMLGRGDFHGFSRAVALDEMPYFVQAIFNPYAPFKGKSLLKLLYKQPYRDDYVRQPPAKLGAGYDALTLAGKVMDTIPFVKGRLLQKLMELSYAGGPDETMPPALGTWGETTETHIPLADLFNGSVTIARDDLVRAFDVIIHAFTKGGGGTVVTCRFMDRAAGLLAPARFPHNAVIDFDGPRSKSSHRSYQRVTAALDEAGIPFTRHWAKTNDLTAARVRRDYGADLDRWRAAQHRLMPDPADRAVFRNDELVRLGLIEA